MRLKRLTAMLLCLLICLSLMPAAAFAEDDGVIPPDTADEEIVYIGEHPEDEETAAETGEETSSDEEAHGDEEVVESIGETKSESESEEAEDSAFEGEPDSEDEGFYGKDETAEDLPEQPEIDSDNCGIDIDFTYSDCVFINPLYADLIIEEDISTLHTDTAPADELLNGFDAVFLDAEGAAKLLVAKLNAREAIIYIPVLFPNGGNASEYWNNVFIPEFRKHVGGDARHNYSKLSAYVQRAPVQPENYDFVNIYYVVKVTYITSDQQEQLLRSKLTEICQSIGVYGTAISDYQKICRIYDYICKNVVYDDDAIYDDALLTLDQTAYTALYLKKSVCGGFSDAFYRLCLEAGISKVHVVESLSPRMNHSWNIVDPGDGNYYYVDATWDINYKDSGNYKYFLRGIDYYLEKHVSKNGYSDTGWIKESNILATDLYNISYSDFSPSRLPSGSNSGSCGNNLTWTYNKNTGALRISGSGTMYNFEKNKAPWQSYAAEINSVTIDEGVTSIGQWAFRSCTGLVSITIPKSVLSIAEGAFSYCSMLSEFYVEPGSTSYKTVDGVLFTYNGKTLVCYPPAKKLSDYTIPNGTAAIAYRAFVNCEYLMNISFPSTVKSIGNTAFIGCSSLASVTIPSGVTAIGESTFQNCTALTNVYIPSSVTSIGKNAFSGCDYLVLYYEGTDIGWNKINIDYSVSGDATGNNALLYAEKHSVYSRDGICGEKLNWYYFNDGTLKINGTGRMYDFAYADLPWRNINSSIKTVILPAGITYIGDNAFRYCTAIASFTIPASVTEIKYSAFTYCDSVTAFTVDANNKNFVSVDGVIYTKDKTVLCFYPAANARTSYTVPEGVTQITGRSFINSKNLKSISLPSTLTSFSNSTFIGCSSLASINIPNKITRIGNNVFQNCTSLKEITLPAGIMEIANDAFNGCTALKTVTFTGKAPVIGENAFKGVTATAYYPAGSTWTASVMQNYGGSITWKSTGHAHSLVHYPAKPATATSEGNIEYWYCTSCGKYYLDAACTRETTRDRVIIPKLAYGVPVITTVANHANYMIVKWNRVEGAVSYRIAYRSDKSAWQLQDVSLYQVDSQGNPRVDFYNLQEGVGYTFMVYAVFSDGSTTRSETATQMRLISPAISVTAQNGYFAISWDAVSGGSQYKLYYREVGGSWQLYTVTKKDCTSTNIKASVIDSRGLTPLVYGKTYEFAVLSATSVQGITSGFPTPLVSCTYAWTLALTSPRPELVNTVSGVAVAWQSCRDAQSYKVYYRVYGSKSWTLGTSTHETDTVICGLTKGKTYEFCVISCANGQTSDFPSKGATITYNYSGASTTGFINGNGVNLRSGPGTHFEIIGTFDRGTSLIFIQDAGNGWYMVSINGITGYVHSSYVLLYLPEK